jgi:hypothetical protein
METDDADLLVADARARCLMSRVTGGREGTGYDDIVRFFALVISRCGWGWEDI